MKRFKNYINENFKELVKISIGVRKSFGPSFEALIKKENFGYNGPMDKSRYDALGLDEFIIVGPSTPVMKWVSKNKKYIVKLAKLPMPKITFASVDVNQYDGENLFEASPIIKNQPSLQQVKKMKADIKKAVKVKHDLVNIQFQDILYVDKKDVKKAQQQLAKTKYKNIEVRAESVREAIDHPAFIDVKLQDFAKHMKRIAPHAKKAGTKLKVVGKDVEVNGLATAIKKMFDLMVSDGKGFYE